MADIQPSSQTASDAMRPLVVVCIVYLVLDSFFVALRFGSRFFIRRSEIGWDVSIAHYESIGDRPANLPIMQPDQLHSQLEPTMKLVFATIILLILGFTLPRISILTLYLRIFAGRRTRILTYSIIAVVTAMGIAFMLIAIVFCKPTRFFWDRTVPGGTCMDFNLYYRSFALPNILVDLVMLITPLPAIWSLEASVARRIGVSAIFLTGILALVSSCVRWAVYSRIDASRVVPRDSAPLLFMNIIECSTYLIAACLPASYPAFEALIPRRIRMRFHLEPSSIPMKYPQKPRRNVVSPALRRMAPDGHTELVNETGFSRLVEPPTRVLSPTRLRPESRGLKEQHGLSRDVSTPKESIQGTRVVEVEDNKVHSMNAYHGRSESRAETVRKDGDDEVALAELRRLASQHRVQMPSRTFEDGLIAVHTEIDVTEEEEERKRSM
ncbi:MAG: hypothetical protein Q9162_003917 [Coniocarpon cinnabarinum]